MNENHSLVYKLVLAKLIWILLEAFSSLVLLSSLMYGSLDYYVSVFLGGYALV